MKYFFTFFYFFLITQLHAQTFTTNTTPVGLEHNLLFNANKGRYVVSQTGQAQVNLDYLFDGRLEPSYSGNAVSNEAPTIITISGLPEYHTQRGAWVGWSTRYWAAKKFKIEGYCTWSISGQTGWVTICDVDDYGYWFSNYYSSLPEGAYSQIRFTFFEGTSDQGAGNRLGLSELFFIHPEATTPYNGLFSSFANLIEKNNNILIGKTSQTETGTRYRLDVEGPIRAHEILVNTTGADFVFDSSYKLPTLSELEAFIKAHKHLPDIAPAKEMQENGVSAGEMQTKLLQKVEELTLYLIELKKENEQLKNEKDKEISDQNKLIANQQQMLLDLKQEIEKLKNK